MNFGSPKLRLHPVSLSNYLRTSIIQQNLQQVLSPLHIYTSIITIVQ